MDSTAFRPRRRWSGLLCAVVILGAVAIAVIIYVAIGLKVTNDCGGSFGLFGTEDDAGVKSCIRSHRGSMLWTSVMIVGAAALLCVWGRARVRRGT
jgi:ABC-type Fe3+ transport system permease subunit